MIPYKIALLCNNRMAYPTLQVLAKQGMLSALIIPENNKEVFSDCQHLLQNYQIPVYGVTKESLVESIEKVISLKTVQSFLVITFPWKIPQSILTNSLVKFYNFHFGSLPELRGVDPIFEAIRQNLSETSISVHVMTNHIDRGPIVANHKIVLTKEITHGMLCSIMGNNAPFVALQLIQQLSQNIHPIVKDQDESKAKYYGKPSLEDVVINWNKMSSEEVFALCRSCNPWNKGAYTRFKNWAFRIVSLEILKDQKSIEIPGTILFSETGECKVACSDGNLVEIKFIYTDEGFYEGKHLKDFGLQTNERLN